MAGRRLPPQTTVDPSLHLTTQKIQPRATTALAAQAIPNYTHLGCYRDSSSRILNGNYTILKRNIPEYCCEWCRNVNTTYKWCGVEAGTECRCGTEPATKSTMLLSSTAACNYSCGGVGTYACGGRWAMNLYSATAALTSAATASGASLTAQTVDRYSYLGCFEDGPSHLISETSTQPKLINPKFCCEWCSNMNPNFRLCGVENAYDCWCGSTTKTSPIPNVAGCTKACTGAPDNQCGANYQINLYSQTGLADTATADPTTATDAAGQTGQADQTQGSNTNLTGGAIAGIIIGVLAALGVAVAVGFWLIRRRRSHGQGHTELLQTPDGQEPLHTKPIHTEPGFSTVNSETHELSPQNTFELPVIQKPVEMDSSNKDT